MADKVFIVHRHLKSMAALGRIFQLGDLYNYHQDLIINGKNMHFNFDITLNLYGTSICKPKHLLLPVTKCLSLLFF